MSVSSSAAMTSAPAAPTLEVSALAPGTSASPTIRGKSHSRSASGGDRARTRSKSGSPDSRARTRSRTGSPRSRSRSRSKPRRSRSRSKPRKSSRSISPRRHSRSRSPRRSPTRSPSPDMDGMRLHVADLDSNASKRDIEDTFTKFGPLEEIWMAKSVPCFAFVVYKNKEDAYEACRAADGLDICGRRVRVTMARPRTRGRGRRGFDPSMRCYQCGERGHFSRDCPDTKYGYKRPPSPRYRSRSRGRYGGYGGYGGRSRSPRDRRYRSRSPRDRRYRSRSRGRY